MLPFLALLGVAAVWFLLPMLPALRELLWPTDVQPLLVVDRSSGDVAFFARNFRQYLQRQTEGLAEAARVGDFAGALPDGTGFVRVDRKLDALTYNGSERTQDRVVVSDRPLTLEGNETFLKEVYARAPLVGGSNAVYRAVYAERELILGEGSRVLRWVHAAGRLTAGAHSVLRGRVSSDDAVSLGGGVVFERIGAPVVSVGREHEPPPDLPALPKEHKLPEGSRRIGDHVRVEGDLEIPAGMRVTSSLVVAGSLKVGLGSLVLGSVKAHRDVELGDEAQVRGAVVAGRRVMIGAAAWVAGPLIAEERVRLGRGAVVGGPTTPATVSAPEVEMSNGATVYGQVTAPAGGRTF